MEKYSIGVDYGSLSARAVIVNLSTGEEVATAVFEYPHGVMESCLPSGKKLGVDYALQHPQDYLDAMGFTVKQVLQKSGVDPALVVGIGVDFTACTVMPTLLDGTPLCFIDEFIDEPHAYVKLWKHHAAQEQANDLNSIAAERSESFLKRYGGKISSEWAIPKVMQVAQQAPNVYDKMDRWIEAADWIVWQLCGKETRNCCTAGYKGIWSRREGYPSKEFFKALNPKMENFIEEKFGREILELGSKAGEITPFASKLTGLKIGTAVAVGNVDAHVAMPAVGITSDKKMLMIMGTSTCHILMGTEEKAADGMCGVVDGGVIKGYFGYEAGQSCVGDHFAWFVKNCVPPDYFESAKAAGQDIHEYLTQKASNLKTGESGLLALDWWNGNRSVLVDVDLSGMMIGQTLATKPEEMYRALIEATAYGTRKIIDTFNNFGVEIESLYAAGGIAEKNSLMMQIYSDVTNRQIRISGSPQAPALGSSMFGAVAAGYFKDIAAAAKVMSKVKDVVYTPIKENVEVYEKLYAEYDALHEYFGKTNDVMKRLKELKKSVKNNDR